ncbi:Transcription factor bHLH150 [Apostasia shenzhenica]|uniref:Transcription factor bHLH150 n=1 Tax=Apostasia shenzhenica TaxID=1088818 RepID=A0A2H9ZTI5_9ASPA|nr:Transcription factor bHLH150 [Apostasia shenzhenica]
MIPPHSSAAGDASSVAGDAAGGTKKTKARRQSPPESKWRRGAQQRIYGRRLLEAIRARPADPRSIKDAADSALALTAGGQTRWSRAVLFGRSRRRRTVHLKAGGKIRRRQLRRKMVAEASMELPPALRRKKVRDRLRVLSKIVPGCRKLSAPSLLEETADYVAALEMQVKTMRALADALSAATLSERDPVHDPHGRGENLES